jgi:hypothetical protein
VALELNKEEREFYTFFQCRASSLADYSLDFYGSTAPAAKRQVILPLIGILRLICDHGQYLLSPKALSAWEQKDASRVDWNQLLSIAKKCDICGTAVEKTTETGLDSPIFPCSYIICIACSNANEKDVSEFLEHDYCPKYLQEAKLPRLTVVIYYGNLLTKRQYKALTKIKVLVRNLRGELSWPLPTGKSNPFKRY